MRYGDGGSVRQDFAGVRSAACGLRLGGKLSAEDSVSGKRASQGEAYAGLGCPAERPPRWGCGLHGGGAPVRLFRPPGWPTCRASWCKRDRRMGCCSPRLESSRSGAPGGRGRGRAAGRGWRSGRGRRRASPGSGSPLVHAWSRCEAEHGIREA